MGFFFFFFGVVVVVLAVLGFCGMWDLSTMTRDRTLVPCIGGRILNHWTTREVPCSVLISTLSGHGVGQG